MSTITTQLNIGDTLWTIYNNKVTSFKIDQIIITIEEDHKVIIYKINKNVLGNIDFPETFLNDTFFTSKENLIEHLKNN